MIASTRFALNNPVAVACVTATIVAASVFAAISIPIDLAPAFRAPAIEIAFARPGMNSDVIEQEIIGPLERKLAGAPGIEAIASRSTAGFGSIRCLFSPAIDRRDAFLSLDSIIRRFQASLPGTEPLDVRFFDPTRSEPSCVVAAPLSAGPFVDRAMRDMIADRLNVFKNIDAPIVQGGPPDRVIVELNREDMTEHGVSPLDVLEAIERESRILPAGEIVAGGKEFRIGTHTAVDLERLKIPVGSGGFVNLNEVTERKKFAPVESHLVRVNGVRHILMPIYQRVDSESIGAGTIRTVQAARRVLDAWKKNAALASVPPKMIMDRSIAVATTIKTLAIEGMLGALMGSLAVMIALCDRRSSFVVALGTLIAIAASIVGLYAAGRSIDATTIAGIALAIGPIVADSTTTLAAARRRSDAGLSAYDSMLEGSADSTRAVVAGRICVLAALIPAALISGPHAYWIEPIAISAGTATLLGFVIAFTFTPCLAARGFPARAVENQQVNSQNDPNYKSRSHSESTDIGSPVFRRVQMFSWKWRRSIAITAMMNLALAIGLIAPRLRSEFFPVIDTGFISATLRAPSGTKLADTEKTVARFESLVGRDFGADVQTIVSEIGVSTDDSAGYTSNAGPMDAVLKIQLKENRKRSTARIVRDLRSHVAADARFQNIEVSYDFGTTLVPAIDSAASAAIDVKIEGSSTTLSRRIAETIQNRIAKIAGVVDSRIVQRIDYPTYFVDVDRAKAALAGIDPKEIVDNMFVDLDSSRSFESNLSFYDYSSRRRTPIGVRIGGEETKGIVSWLNYPVIDRKTRRSIPIRGMVSIMRGATAVELDHSNLRSTVDLTTGVEGRDLSEVVAEVSSAIGEIGVPDGAGKWIPRDLSAGKNQKSLISGATIELKGRSSAIDSAKRSLGVSAILTLICICMIVAMIYRSYIVPLAIVAAAATGLIGATILLYLTDTAIDAQSLFGMIVMFGITASQALLLIDCAEGSRVRRGLVPFDAIKRAFTERGGTVVVASFASILSALPFALAPGRGSEALTSLGRTIVGFGLTGVVGVIFVAPAVYALTIRNRAGASTSRG